jgi:hypothetical protein
MRNSEFLAAVYGELRENYDYGWTTAFASDPSKALPNAWSGNAYMGTDNEKAIINQRQEDNAYFCVSVLYSRDGKKRRSKELFNRLAVLLADDADPNQLMSMPSYVLETSPSRFQIGVLLDPDDPDTRNLPLIDAVLSDMAARKLISADSSGNNPVRYARLPVGSNTKARPEGIHTTRLISCDLREKQTLLDAAGCFGLDLEYIRKNLYSGQSAKDDTKSGPSDISQLYKDIINPDLSLRSYHDALLKISSSMVASGMHKGAVVNHLRSIMMAAKPLVEGPEMERWRVRIGPDLVRMVESAGKFAPDDEAAAPGAKPPFPKLLLDMEQLKERTANVNWVVRGVIAEDSTICLFGASSTFKSFVALSGALHIATGQEWLGLRTKKGPVVYCAAEGGAGIYRRAAAWAKVNLGQEFVPDFKICITPLNLTVQEEMASLRMDIAEMSERPVLIVLDTLSQMFGGGDENDATKVSEFFRAVNQHLRAPFGSTVMIIHHTGYNVDAANRPRGSSAIAANLDGLLSIQRSDPEALTCKMSIVKVKDGERPEIPFYFDLESVDLGVDQYGDRQTSLVAKWSDKARQAAENLKAGKYSSLILKMLASGEPVTTHEFRMAAAPLGGDNADNVRRAINRVLVKLKEARKIYEKSPDVWVIEQ